MEFIAHRGASHDAPENTLAAARLAWEQRADAIEVDVQLSRDGRLIVIHDGNTKRTAGLNRKVSNLTLAQLKTLEAGAWKGRRWAGEPIPTLGEILEAVPSHKRIFVEIKCGPAGLPEFVRVLRHSRRKLAQVAAIGFDLETMKQVKEALPRVEVCSVVKFRRGWRTGRWLPRASDLIAKALSAGLDGLDLGASGPLNSTLFKLIHEAGLKCYVWTVDNPAQARQLREAGLDGITTNRPGWLRERLERQTR
jgi:glycerophosphoryl diester phosphodiesterase